MTLVQHLTIGLLALAALFGGVLAGMAIEKTIVDLAAWAYADKAAWAEFTRVHEVGLRFLSTPIVGGSALAVTAAAALGVKLAGASMRAGAIPAYAAAVLAIIALVETFTLIGPARLALNQAPSDAFALQELYDKLAFAWRIKAALHLVTFALNLWALAAAAGVRGALASIG